MKREPEHETTRREYRSELRAEQAQATRDRIVEAVKTRVAAGDRDVTYASIARTARVSVPTVYRHFPTRQDLFDAIYASLEAGQPTVADVPDTADLLRGVRHFYARFDDPEGVFGRVTRLNTIWEMSRATTVPRRAAWFANYVDHRFPGLPEPQRTYVIDMGVVALSSAMAEAMRGYLDRSGAETAERVAFTLEALFAYARTFCPEDSP